MKVLIKIFFTFVLLCSYRQGFAQQPISTEQEYTYDTPSANVFEGADSFSFKLNYYNTWGISTGDRYWYEVIILDTLVILNFKSPHTETFNYVSYQKRMVISDSALATIKSAIRTLGIAQKRKGIPDWRGSAYAAERLFIESPHLKIAGGNVCMIIGEDGSEAAANKRMKMEQQRSSSISGNYAKFFKQLDSYFVTLPQLLKECMRQY